MPLIIIGPELMKATGEEGTHLEQKGRIFNVEVDTRNGHRDIRLN